jgi:hypothetical protein
MFHLFSVNKVLSKSKKLVGWFGGAQGDPQRDR